MTVRLLVADDQDLIREGLATILAAQPDLEVVGAATDGEEAVRLVRELRPDVTLMDIRMPRTDGLQATRQLLVGTEHPPTRVLVLTTFDDDALVLDALRAGASGFLLKDVPRRRLVEAIHAVHAGDLELSPAITRRLVERQLGVRRDPGRAAALGRLTEREVEVLRLIARGASNTELAEGLHLSQSTIKTHVGQLLHKLEVRDRVQLVIFAYDVGLVD
ncbi:MAG: response regulator transcription factor [Actinomycetota bacterium]|nr:response regulator transcription factor [Actinomycetota bacterium]